MAQCKFCGNDRKLIKAHAIPESFFRLLRDGQDFPRMVSNVTGKYPKRIPIGAYDSEILCEECEPKFQKCDDYAGKILVNNLSNFKELVVDGEILQYSIPECNYDLLKQFLVSMLWRASVSSHYFYAGVNLGPWEERAKKFIDAGVGGSENEFSAFFSTFVDKEQKMVVGSGMLNPISEKWHGVRAYRFYLGGVVAHIKVDQQSFRDPFTSLIFRQGQQLNVLARDLANSKDLKAMEATVRGAYN